MRSSLVTLTWDCLNIHLHSSVRGIVSCQQVDYISPEAQGHSSRGGPPGLGDLPRKGALSLFLHVPSPLQNSPTQREGWASRWKHADHPSLNIPLQTSSVASSSSSRNLVDVRLLMAAAPLVHAWLRTKGQRTRLLDCFDP